MSEAAAHFWTASDGIGLAYHEVGQGHPVILLHGLFSDANVNWIRFGHAGRIARDGFRVIMPDLRAHGQSGKPHEPEHYPKGILARDLRELVANLGLKDFDLGGFSLGVGAVLFVGLAIGAFAPKANIVGPIGLTGLIMFLYGIGILYGRQFFEGMAGSAGIKANLIALVGVIGGLLVWQLADRSAGSPPSSAPPA